MARSRRTARPPIVAGPPTDDAPIVAGPPTDDAPIVAGPPTDDAPIAVPLTHEPSGEVCRIPVHADGDGPCQRCRHCEKKYRPREMGDPCPARSDQPRE